jgi:glycerol-3-phosphate cytidylyltransferase
MTDRIYVGGTFDLFHCGHVALLRRASELGPVTVALNTDEFAAEYKRPPILTLAERTELVAACRYVENVIVNTGGQDSKPSILVSGCNVIVHGDDWTGELLLTQLDVSREWLDAHGVRMHYLPYTPGISSAVIEQRILAARSK